MKSNTYWMNKVLAVINENLPNKTTNNDPLDMWWDAIGGMATCVTPLTATRTRATVRSMIDESLVTFYVDNNGTVRMETPQP